MSSTRKLTGLLIAGAALWAIPAQADPLAQDTVEGESTPSQQVAVVPDVDREEVYVPAAKLEMIALVSVPERPPVPSKVVAPGFPAFARRCRLQGTVLARVLVDTTGAVVRVGRIEGNAVFHEAVRQAAKQWEFTPARQGRLAVKSWVTVPFSFEL